MAQETQQEQQAVEDAYAEAGRWLGAHGFPKRAGGLDLSLFYPLQEAATAESVRRAPRKETSDPVRRTQPVTSVSSQPSATSRLTLQKTAVGYGKAAAAAPPPAPAVPPKTSGMALATEEHPLRVPLESPEDWPDYQRRMLRIREIADYLLHWSMNRDLRQNLKNAASHYSDKIRDDVIRSITQFQPQQEDGEWDDDDIERVLKQIAKIKHECFDILLPQGNSREMRKLDLWTPERRFYTGFSTKVDVYMKALGFEKLLMKLGDPFDRWNKKFIQTPYWEPAPSPEMVRKIYQIDLYPYRAFYGAKGQKTLEEFIIGGVVTVYKEGSADHGKS